MKLTIAALCVGALALGACERIENDPDIQEARTAIEGAVEDDGAALKQVYNEARATRSEEEAAAANEVGVGP